MDESMNRFDDDEYEVGQPLSSYACRVEAIVWNGKAEFAEGDLLRPWNYHINYRMMNQRRAKSRPVFVEVSVTVNGPRRLIEILAWSGYIISEDSHLDDSSDR